MQNPNIPAAPVAAVDTQLDPNAAAAAAEQALAAPIPLLSTFTLSKIRAEVTGRHPGGLSYRRILPGALASTRVSDGYLSAAPNGQGGTRVTLHENRRYMMIAGLAYLAGVAIMIASYFLFFRETAPANPYGVQYGGYPGMGYPQTGYPGMGGTGTGTPWWLIGAIIGYTLFIAFHLYEIRALPKKTADRIRQGAFGGASYGQPGFPPPHPGGFPPQGQPGHPPFGAAPQPGFPPQPGQPPLPGMPPQPGYPPQPQQPPFGGQPPQPPQPTPDVEHKLREFAGLRDSGVITEEDYQKARGAILRGT